jgi:hypothetical protein
MQVLAVQRRKIQSLQNEISHHQSVMSAAEDKNAQEKATLQLQVMSHKKLNLNPRALQTLDPKA